LLTHQTFFFPSDFDSLRTFWTKKNSTTQQKRTDGLQKKALRKAQKKFNNTTKKYGWDTKKSIEKRTKKIKPLKKKAWILSTKNRWSY
jgi:hypothetical protein